MQPQKRLILISLCVGIVLMLAKFTAYFFTSSNAILTDAAESIVNIVASAFAFYSIYYAAQPRDQNHPYGHGKIEFFAAGIEGLLIGLAGLIIIVKSIYALFFVHKLQNLGEGTIIIAITGLINWILGYSLIKGSQQYHSLTLYADGKHLQTDAYSSFGLVVGLFFIQLTGIYWMDNIFSILLGTYIVFNGYKLTRKSVSGLMDEADFEIVEKIINILNNNRRPPWIDVHNLRAQKYGAELHIDCHLTLPWYFDLQKVHDEVSAVDKLIAQHTEVKTEFFIHADPCLYACCHYCRMENCPVRSEPQSEDFQWTIDNAMKNQKHFRR